MPQLTPALSARGWVLRPQTVTDDKARTRSDPILVRGARLGDDPWDRKHGFIYAETAKMAEDYDRQHGYTN